MENSRGQDRRIGNIWRGRRAFLVKTIRENAGSLDPIVWDRAYAALGAIVALDPAKVAARRATFFKTTA